MPKEFEVTEGVFVEALGPDEAQDPTMERLRTRWRRWLGNKSATGRPYWVTLLDSRWSCWCRRVCQQHGIEYGMMEWNRESVKQMYRTCIDAATLDELLALDNIYASEKVSGR